MTLTTQQQAAILQLSQVMFNTTPGAIFLDVLGAQLQNGTTIANLAQSLFATNLFIGHLYNERFPSSFAENLVEDLTGDQVSVENKTWAVQFITDKLTAGATQAGVVAELAQTLSAMPVDDPNWGRASTYFNTRIAEKVLFRLAGNTIPADEAQSAIKYFADQIAAGQTVGAMVEWAIKALDGVEHSGPTWGKAAALFDNRIAASHYYSVDKTGTTTAPLSLQYILSTMKAGVTLDDLINLGKVVTLLSNEASEQNYIVLSKILGGITDHPATVEFAKAEIDNFLKGNINVYGLNGQNGFSLSNKTVDENSDYQVSSAGDFNGDGYDDVMMGGYYVDSTGVLSETNYVVFGKAAGFSAMTDVSSLDGSNGFRISGLTDVDVDGYKFSNAGDINGDGFDDLIIGITFYTAASGFSNSAYVVFGKAAGFGATLDVSNQDGSSGFRIDGMNVGEDPDDFVSNAGDFNGDGYDDVIIGSEEENASYLVFGKASGFDALLDLSNLKSNEGLRLSGASSGHWVSAAGDVNGDGLDDVMIDGPAASSNDVHSVSNYVVFGRAAASSASLDLASLDGSDGFRMDAAAADDNAVYSINPSFSPAGDVNGDGWDDLIIGVPDADPNGENSGSSYVLFGRASGFNAVVDLTSVNGKTGFRLDGGRATYNAGSTVSGIGDFNGDGFDDLLVGAPGADPDGFWVGATYVVFGKASGFSSSFNLSDLDGNNGLILKGLHFGHQLGRFISDAGDVNGDGLDDFILGALKGNLDGGILNFGAGHVVFGMADAITVPRGARVEGNSLSMSNSDLLSLTDTGDGLTMEGSSHWNDDVVIGNDDLHDQAPVPLIGIDGAVGFV